MRASTILRTTGMLLTVCGLVPVGHCLMVTPATKSVLQGSWTPNSTIPLAPGTPALTISAGLTGSPEKVVVVLSGIYGGATPASFFNVVCRAKMASAGTFRIKLDLFDFVTSSYVAVLDSPITTTFAVFTGASTSPFADFIGPLNKVQTRLTVERVGAGSGAVATIDDLYWDIQ